MTAVVAPPTAVTRIGGTIVRLLLLELRIYASIGRALVRRPAIPVGAQGFRYHRPVTTILIIFIALSAIEIPIIDLIVHRWPVPRVVLLILGIWGVTWMVGLLCAYLMRPHTVGPAGIRVREGLETDIPIGWNDIAAVTRRPRVDEPKSPRLIDHNDGRMLLLRMQDETNVEVTLEGPTQIRLPGYFPKGGSHTITAIRFWVDDLDGFITAVRHHIP